MTFKQQKPRRCIVLSQKILEVVREATKKALSENPDPDWVVKLDEIVKNSKLPEEEVGKALKKLNRQKLISTYFLKRDKTIKVLINL